MARNHRLAPARP